MYLKLSYVQKQIVSKSSQSSVDTQFIQNQQEHFQTPSLTKLSISSLWWEDTPPICFPNFSYDNEYISSSGLSWSSLILFWDKVSLRNRCPITTPTPKVHVSILVRPHVSGCKFLEITNTNVLLVQCQLIPQIFKGAFTAGHFLYSEYMVTKTSLESNAAVLELCFSICVGYIHNTLCKSLI